MSANPYAAKWPVSRRTSYSEASLQPQRRPWFEICYASAAGKEAMADIDQKDLTIEEATTRQPESSDPAYLAWKRQKIEAALMHAGDHRNDVLTEQEIWQKHGLGY